MPGFKHEVVAGLGKAGFGMAGRMKSVQGWQFARLRGARWLARSRSSEGATVGRAPDRPGVGCDQMDKGPKPPLVPTHVQHGLSKGSCSRDTGKKRRGATRTSQSESLPTFRVGKGQSGWRPVQAFLLFHQAILFHNAQWSCSPRTSHPISATRRPRRL
jgi:hypothetical protein